MEYITVQRLSSNVEGRYQKYACIGVLTMVPLGCEPRISNIKETWKGFFKAEDMECDILADTETVFLDTVVYKGTRFNEKSILDLKTHFEKTITFQYKHFISCHQPSVKKKFCQALRILQTNSRNYIGGKYFKFKETLDSMRLPTPFDRNLLSEIKFTKRGVCTPETRQQTGKRLALLTQYQPSVSTLKEAFIRKWNLTQDQLLLRQISKKHQSFPIRKENP